PVHTFILTSFAVTEPCYCLLGQHMGFVIDLELGLPSILWFVLIMSAIVPGLVSLVQWALCRCLPRAVTGIGAVTLFLLLALMTLPVIKRLAFPGWMSLGMSLVAAASAAGAYFRYQPVRSLVTCAAPGALVFPAFLLFASPVSQIWFP